MKLLLLSLTLPLLTGCTWGLLFIKEGAMELTSHYGIRRATIIVETPANFYASYTAYYKPRIPENCQFYGVGTGGYYTRDSKQKFEKSETRNLEQAIKFKVPLTYHIGTCTMHLSGLKTEIESTNNRGSSTSLDIISTTQKTNKNTLGEKTIRNLCDPSFVIKAATNDIKKISMYLPCKKANEQWQLLENILHQPDLHKEISFDELRRTPVRYIYRITQNERPLFPKNWIKSESGWKPCAPISKSLGEGACSHSESKFTDFQTPDGRICTIYPGCTE
ncbi:hypothetical protein KJF94_07380 [Pseudomonas hormoni]|uniref:Lipoprotein n=1 Tax=Pseudomonas hormoni TaxID=3093767 RepID=A0ABX8F216_9PSED|nr:hypothetical protein [Pseudomonas hormoni]QVW25385.1 hypothetical protein KJF94_07380 [Pseudomonas hormoni]